MARNLSYPGFEGFITGVKGRFVGIVEESSLHKMSYQTLSRLSIFLRGVEDFDGGGGFPRGRGQILGSLFPRGKVHSRQAIRGVMP